ncbi:MAG: hypothetical protein KAR30_09920, partial [Gammaproteobacteria bacterium]|nr:hypothetical protein [Gammaproteobacteria bacterium]
AIWQCWVNSRKTLLLASKLVLKGPEFGAFFMCMDALYAAVPWMAKSGDVRMTVQKNSHAFSALPPSMAVVCRSAATHRDVGS